MSITCRFSKSNFVDNLKGKKLMHDKYGHGKIIEVKGDTVRIRFDNSKCRYRYFSIDFVRKSDVFTFSDQWLNYSRRWYYLYS